MAHPNKIQNRPPGDDPVATIVALLTNRDGSIADLADMTGLGLSDLAALLESDPIQTALADLRRIARVRHDFLAAEADCTATATLLSLATAAPDSPRAADQARKAATCLRKPAPVSKRGGGGGGTRSETQAEAPQPPPKPTPRPPAPTITIAAHEIPTTPAHPTPPPRHASATTPRPTPAQLRATTGADRPP